MVYVGNQVLRFLKEELACGIDLWLQVTSDTVLFKTVIAIIQQIKNKRVLNLK